MAFYVITGYKFKLYEEGLYSFFFFFLTFLHFFKHGQITLQFSYPENNYILLNFLNMN